MTDDESPPAEQLAFERRFRELLLDIWQANPLSEECRPGLNVRPDGDRLVVIGFRRDNGEAVELGSLPTNWVAGTGKR